MGKAKGNQQHSMARFVFIAYCILMLWLLFGQRMEQQTAVKSMNLVPLDTLKLYLKLMHSSSAYLVRHAYVNLIGNVVMFIPLGALLPQIWKGLRSFFKIMLLAILVVILVETLQYLTALGSCDVDDFILNVPGVMLGYLLWRLLHRK